MKREIDKIIAVLCFLMIFVLWYVMEVSAGWPWMMAAFSLGILHLYLYWKENRQNLYEKEFISPHGQERAPGSTLTEVVLLSENDDHLASWTIYQKNGIVIGRDVGENNVTINLDKTTYASMIDVEHAVLNYSGNDWYIEDLSEQNGVSVQKSDGRKYKLSYGNPCKLERGDIIFIAMTRLQIL